MPSVAARGPLPLSAAQVSALIAATTRELVWGRRAVSRELRTWRARATRIEDGPLRTDAFEALTDKRGATHGAALFWTLLPQRDPQLLRLLVAHELIWNYLDNTNERPAAAAEANGRQLHRALVESLDPARPISDYYRHHPWREDGGFLVELVSVCRELCRSLPSYPIVRPVLIREATRGVVQSLNHVEQDRREAVLRAWAAEEYPEDDVVRWFELTAAASGPLAILPLLALAGEARCSREEVDAVYAAYFPWVSLATVMLDSYVDQHEDVAQGKHSYIAWYGSDAEMLARLHESIARAAQSVLQLRNGRRHAVIVGCMVAMYLSRDSARSPGLRATSRELARASGSLPRLLLPAMHVWRMRYGRRSA